MAGLNHREVDTTVVNGDFMLSMAIGAVTATGTAVRVRDVALSRSVTSTVTAVRTRLIALSRSVATTATAVRVRLVNRLRSAAAGATASMTKLRTLVVAATVTVTGTATLRPLLIWVQRTWAEFVSERIVGSGDGHRLVVVEDPGQRILVDADDDELVPPRNNTEVA